MANVAKIGSPISHGGQVTSGSSRMLVNGVPISRIGDSVNCTQNNHGSRVITTGSPRLIVMGQPVALVGDSTSCGASITSGDSRVNVS